MENIELNTQTPVVAEEEKGASMLEYALLAALIAIVAIAAVTFLGQQSCRTFSIVGQHMGNANALQN